MEFAGDGVPAPRMIYRPLILAQKQQGGFRVLTEGLGRLELQRRGADGDVPRRRRDEAGGPGGAGLLRALGPHGSMIGGAAKRTRGVSVARVRPAARIREGKSSPAVAGGSASSSG